MIGRTIEFELETVGKVTFVDNNVTGVVMDKVRISSASNQSYTEYYVVAQSNGSCHVVHPRSIRKVFNVPVA